MAEPDARPTPIARRSRTPPGRDAVRPHPADGEDVARGAAGKPVGAPGVLIAVTDHAAERYRQRVRGTLDAKREIIARVSRARDAGAATTADRGTVLVRDRENRDLVFVCRPDRDELVVVTLWEEGEDAAVPRRFTDALRERRRG